MKIYVHDAAQNPDAEVWSPRELDEGTTKRLFDRLRAPESFIIVEFRECASLSVTFMGDETWSVDISYSDTRKARSGTIGREDALRFLEAAFRGKEADLLAERFQLSWDDIPAPIGFTTFHPGRSHLRTDGAIVIPAGGYEPDFGIWDGHVTVERSHPNYRLWLWIRDQPKWQNEDSKITDQNLEILRKEFVGPSPDESNA